MELHYRAQLFMERNPTKIGTVLGRTYYEHPTRGDEAPLYYISDEGRLCQSSFYELPSVEEMLEDY